MRALLLFIFISGTITPSFSADSYNALRWNRYNYMADNGKVDTGPWFEWWYYKVVIPETEDSFYFVYGVVNPWDIEEVNDASRSYVGMGNFKENEVVEELYSVSDFSASYEKTFVRIQQNIASENHIIGAITDKYNGPVFWNINIEHSWRFNAMGWSMYFPWICNIFWYPAQADAYFSGEIFYKGKHYHFKNAPGYQDRNWGTSFPDWWVWIVANHFEGHPETTLATGGGRPDILNIFKFTEGVAIGLKHKGKTYSFRPNDFDRVEINICFGVWEVKAWNRHYKIEVSAYAPQEEFLDLQFLTPEGEVFHDYETLTGELTIKLYERVGDSKFKLIETLYSDYAGIEYGSYDVYDFGSLFAGERVLL